MILAGDEFADQHDLSVGNPAKQRDAVNYDRLDEPFRRRDFRLRVAGWSSSARRSRPCRSTTRRSCTPTSTTEAGAGVEARPRRQRQSGGRRRQLLRLRHRHRASPRRRVPACPTGPPRRPACAGARSRRIATSPTNGSAASRSSRGKRRSMCCAGLELTLTSGASRDSGLGIRDPGRQGYRGQYRQVQYRLRPRVRAPSAQNA